ncbi:bifunctional purple acid phosphatase 26-like protein [Tanacetum coccineum]
MVGVTTGWGDTLQDDLILGFESSDSSITTTTYVGKLNQENPLMEHGHQDYGVNIITSSDFPDSKIYTTIPDYITVGDGGNEEGLALRFNDPQPDYSAFREANYRLSTPEIMNKTHAFYHWNRNDDGKKVAADTFVLYNQYWLGVVKNGSPHLAPHAAVVQLSAASLLTASLLAASYKDLRPLKPYALLFYSDRLEIQHIEASMNSKCILYAANARLNAASSNLGASLFLTTPKCYSKSRRRGFGSALNIETLVATVEHKETPIDETIKGLGPGYIFILTVIAK